MREIRDIKVIRGRRRQSNRKVLFLVATGYVWFVNIGIGKNNFRPDFPDLLILLPNPQILLFYLFFITRLIWKICIFIFDDFLLVFNYFWNLILELRFLS